jgi:transposase
VVVTLILDLLDPEEARRPPMAMKDYSDEFKTRASLLTWASTGRRCVSGCCVAENAVSSSPRLRSRALSLGRRCRPLIRTSGCGSWRPGWPELEASERKLATERDILREAAGYFAGESNWWGAASGSLTTIKTPRR